MILSRWRFVMVVLAVFVGCGYGVARSPESSEEQLYNNALDNVQHHQYTFAVKRLKKMQFTYPVGQHIASSYLALIYSEYKKGDYEDALESINQFLRLYPRSEYVDYVFYMQGMIGFTRTDSSLRDFFGLQLAQNLKKLESAFRAFQDIVQYYPKSRYADDALIKMRQIRNILAERELSIAQYYDQRGASVAVINRVIGLIWQYPGAPATLRGLALLGSNYRALGLNSWAQTVTAEEIRLNLSTA